jgi:uncharacterized LabA/DUF88 family protein
MIRLLIMSTEPQVKRAVAFVDGQALFFAARQVFGYQRVNYDVAALSLEVCRQQGWELAQTRFYTGVPLLEKNPTLYNFWTLKLMQMRRQGVHVFTRNLKYKQNTTGTHRGGYGEPTFTRREKGIDIRLALDVVKLAHKKAYDIALLFSQDQDFSELVDDVAEIAKQQIRCIEVASAFPCSPEAPNKRGIDRTSWIEINRATYDACLDPQNYSPTPIALKESDMQIWQDLL